MEQTLDFAELRLLKHKERRAKIKGYKRKMKRREIALEHCERLPNGELCAVDVCSEPECRVPPCWHMAFTSVLPALRNELALAEFQLTQLTKSVQHAACSKPVNEEPRQNCSAMAASGDYSSTIEQISCDPSEEAPNKADLIEQEKPAATLLVAPTQINQRHLRPVECPYFLRVGCCPNAFISHTMVDASSIVLLPNMYRRFALVEPSLGELTDEDFWLTYDEAEIYEDFCDFYLDAISELKMYGRIMKTVVCRNAVHYLRGNVYVEYKECTEAFNALTNLYNRWYDRQQLSPRFVQITWSNAICEEFVRSKCTRPSTCGLLHPFKNPKCPKQAQRFEVGSRQSMPLGFCTLGIDGDRPPDRPVYESGRRHHCRL
uniref:C3H1-type domain-containing protein n=1 Tax=Trichuris muris TaxID=70415 RepID=A0A5S6Q2I5_TRIMR